MTNVFVVKVEDCNSIQMVYALKVDNTTNLDIIICGGRDLPKGCYSLLRTFPNLVIQAEETNVASKIGTEPQNSNLFFSYLSGLLL